jgi:hypothetical protein
MTVATDIYFSGLTCWATQILLSLITLEKANRLYLRPQQLYTEAAASLATWNFAGASVFLDIDFLYLPDPLVSKIGYYRRVLPFTPSHALDLGVDRDAVADFTGFAIPNDLMVSRGLVSLEERTAYLIQAKAVRDSLIDEWNLFADIQQSLWITILFDESAQTLPLRESITLTNFFDPTAPVDVVFGTQITYMPAAYIRNIDRNGYEAAITKWLLDSGTTARSGGVAVSNDTYINWLSGLLADCLADINLIPRRSIDPREIYKFAPRIQLSIGGDGSNGITGVADVGKPDPADDKQSKALDLLEELANRGDGISATLGSPSTNNIDTLPEC